MNWKRILCGVEKKKKEGPQFVTAVVQVAGGSGKSRFVARCLN